MDITIMIMDITATDITVIILLMYTTITIITLTGLNTAAGLLNETLPEASGTPLKTGVRLMSL